MFPETLPQNGKKVLKKLATRELLNKFYLAGGTGLALQLGHRKSVDFDFFTEEDFNTSQYINLLHSIIIC